MDTFLALHQWWANHTPAYWLVGQYQEKWDIQSCCGCQTVGEEAVWAQEWGMWVNEYVKEFPNSDIKKYLGMIFAR